MSQTLTMSDCGLFYGAAADHRRSLEDAIGFRDRMDERTRKTCYAVPDAVPIVGPRGGIRRPNIGPGYKPFQLDYVCEDVDEEEAMVERLDGDVETDEEETVPVTAGFRTEDDDRITVNGLDLETYLAYVVDAGRDYGLTCDALPLTAAELLQDELEAETPKSYSPTSETVRRQAERFWDRSLAWSRKSRKQCETAAEHDLLAEHVRSFDARHWEQRDLADIYRESAERSAELADSLDRVACGLTCKAVIMAKGERSDARDRRLRERAAKRDRSRNAERAFVGELREQFLAGDIDPWDAFIAIPGLEERDERQDNENEYQWQVEEYAWCSCCNPEYAALQSQIDSGHKIAEVRQLTDDETAMALWVDDRIEEFVETFLAYEPPSTVFNLTELMRLEEERIAAGPAQPTPVFGEREERESFARLAQILGRDPKDLEVDEVESERDDDALAEIIGALGDDEDLSMYDDVDDWFDADEDVDEPCEHALIVGHADDLLRRAEDLKEAIREERRSLLGQHLMEEFERGAHRVRGPVLLSNWGDEDLYPYVKLAKAAGAENEPSFFRRRQS